MTKILALAFFQNFFEFIYRYLVIEIGRIVVSLSQFANQTLNIDWCTEESVIGQQISTGYTWSPETLAFTPRSLIDDS